MIMYLILSIKAINLNRRQSNFIDSVTHELKSPIASMKLYLQTLGRRQVSQRGAGRLLPLHARRPRPAGPADQPGARRGPAGVGPRWTARWKTCRWPPLLRDCANTVCLRYRVPAETVRFDLEPCTVRGRRVDLDILFRNLIDNAVKYAGRAAAGRGDAAAGCRGGRAVVRIADNGRGIPPKFRRQIFGRFERLGLELEREKPGTGLGLYIVRNLARRLHAHASASATATAGPGTVFEVQLAAASSAAPPEDCSRVRIRATALESIHPWPPTSTSWSSKTKSTWRRGSSTTSSPRATA